MRRTQTDDQGNQEGCAGNTPPYPRGYGAMFARHVTQADKGCDFDFLERGAPIPDPEIH